MVKIPNSMSDKLLKLVECSLSREDYIRICRVKNKKDLVSVLISIFGCDVDVFRFLIDNVWIDKDKVFRKNEIFLIREMCHNGGFLLKSDVDMVVFGNPYFFRTAIEELSDIDYCHCFGLPCVVDFFDLPIRGDRFYFFNKDFLKLVVNYGK